jgi:hypothetical protein
MAAMMTTSRAPHLTDRGTLVVLILLALAAALAASLLWQIGYLMNDTAQYVSTARHLLRGEGYATSALYLPDHHAAGAPAPMLAWPPGYPTLIALASLLGVPIVLAPAVLAVASYVLLPLCIYLVLRLADVSRVAAAAWAAIWLLAPRSMEHALQGLSDPAFLLFQIAGLALYLRARRTSPSSLPLLALAGATMGAAASIRYIGVALLGALALAELLAFLKRRTGRGKVEATAVLLPALVIGTVAILRNAWVSGAARGGEVIAPDMDLITLIKTFYWTGLKVFGTTPSGGQSVLWLALVCLAVAACLACAVRVWRRERSPAAGGSAPRTLLVRIAVLNIAATVLLHAFAASVNIADAVNVRYLYDILPWLGLALLPLVVHLPGAGTAAKAARLSAYAFLVAFAAGQASTLPGVIERLRQSDGLTVKAALDESMTGPAGKRSVGEFLAAQVADGQAVLDLEGQLINLHVDRTTVGLPSRLYTDRYWTEQDIRALVAAHDVRFVTLIPDAAAERTQAGQGVPFYSDLLAGWAPEWLEPVHTGRKITIWRVR